MTREEFKEFVGLYRKAYENFDVYANYFNENLLDELLFPAFTFITKAIGLYEESYGDLVFGGLVGSCHDRIFTDKDGADTEDLDIIYDRYVQAAYKTKE